MKVEPARREDARQKILAVANRDRLAVAPPFTNRTIQRAVARVRNRRLVPMTTLVVAGFNAHGPNYRPKKKDA